MFRKNDQSKFKLVSSGIVYENRFSSREEELEDGSVECRIVPSLVNVTDPSFEASVPDFSDYTLSNLLKAGIPLQEVDCMILNPSDPADLEFRGVDLSVRALDGSPEVDTTKSVTDDVDNDNSSDPVMSI